MGNIEKSFPQNVLKTYGGNLNCMIKVVKRCSYNQNFVLWGLSGLVTRLCTCIKLWIFKKNVFFSECARAIFTGFHMWPSDKRVLIICLSGSAPLNKMATIPIYRKNT